MSDTALGYLIRCSARTTPTAGWCSHRIRPRLTA